MKWLELPLYRAIHQVRAEMLQDKEQPNSERWFVDMESRLEFAQRVMLKMDLNTASIVEAHLRFRKGSGVGENGEKKLELICQVSELHGDKCFYANRGLGPCSDDVHLDRIVPGSRGGGYSIANCVLACGFHNTSRGDSSIEEFLSRATHTAEPLAT